MPLMAAVNDNEAGKIKQPNSAMEEKWRQRKRINPALEAWLKWIQYARARTRTHTHA